MREKGYYSLRTGKNPEAASLDLDALKRLFLSLYQAFENKGYFQEALGYECVDAGQVLGVLGADIEGALLLAVRKSDLWPLSSSLPAYTEDDLFDVMEFLYDQISKPVEGYHHSFRNCGFHWSTFNSEEGRAEF